MRRNVLLFRSLTVNRFCYKYSHRNLRISSKLMEKEPKFYFAGSIRGGLGDVELYKDLIKYLQTFGHVFTEHIGSSYSTSSGMKFEISR